MPDGYYALRELVVFAGYASGNGTAADMIRNGTYSTIYVVP
jgi:hypothetical protein